MHKQIKTQWVKALTGGKYKQGKLRLRTDEGGYCCLGVLCDMYAKSPEGKKKGAYWDESNLFHTSKRTDGERTDLPSIVEKWAGGGIRSAKLKLGRVRLRGRYSSVSDYPVTLMGLNDDTKVGFRGIARRIKAEL